jgi:hypothetical protein
MMRSCAEINRMQGTGSLLLLHELHLLYDSLLTEMLQTEHLYCSMSKYLGMEIKIKILD